MSAVDLVVSAVGMVGALLVGWLAVRSPSWAIALVVSSVPLQAYGRIGSDGMGLTWTQAWLWAFLAVGAVLFASGTLRLQLDVVNGAFAAVVVCYIASRHAAIDISAWRNEVYRWSVTLTFLVVARGLTQGRRPVLPLIVVTVVGAIWTGVVAIGQVAEGGGPTSFERAGRPRAYASFGEPNTYGAFAAGCVVVLGSVLFWRRRSLSSRQSVVVAVGCSFGAIGLLLSQSRGALAATVVVLGTMALIKLSGHASLPRSARGSGVVAVIVLALLVTPRAVAEISRWDDDTEVTSASWADQERLAHWRAAARMVVESGGVGVGAGQFDSRYREVTPTWRFHISQGHAHNAYLQVAAESGLLGLGAYLSVLTVVLAVLVRRIRRSGTTLVVVGAVAATSVFALHNLVDYLHVLNLPIILVAWWATALAPSEGPMTTS